MKSEGRNDVRKADISAMETFADYNDFTRRFSGVKERTDCLSWQFKN
jgi:hypothetical protein